MRPPERRVTSRAKRASASPWIEVAGCSFAMPQVRIWARAPPQATGRNAVTTVASRAVDRVIRVPSGPRIAHLSTVGAGRSRIAPMRAAVMRDRRLVVADLPVPEPGPGEVLVKTLACGICGSDLHALKHAEQFVAASRRAGSVFTMDLSRDVEVGATDAAGEGLDQDLA